MTWNEFVKKIREERKITYKEALKVASPLWQKQKKEKAAPVKKKKKTTKKKKYEDPPEVTEFPKPAPVKPERTRRKIAVTTTKNVTNIGGRIINPYNYDKPKKRRTHSILLDSAYKYTARKSKV